MPEKHETQEHPKAPSKQAAAPESRDVEVPESPEGVPYQASGLYEDGEENPGPYPGGEGKNAPGYDDESV